MIHLEFFNRAFDLERPDIVFYQLDQAQSRGVVAWKVIHRCGPDWRHPFVVPEDLDLGLIDPWGNYSHRLSAQVGRRYTLRGRGRGAPSWTEAVAHDPTRIEVINGLDHEVVGCRISRGGRLVLPVEWLCPGVQTSFSVNLQLWVGAVRKVREGELLSPYDLSTTTTSFDLQGIRRAEIWMTGGGMGASATAFRFHLCNLEPKS